MSGLKLKLKWRRGDWWSGSRDKLKAVPNPYRDWRRLISVWLLLIILIFVGHYWLLRRLDSLGANSTPLTDSSARFSKFEDVIHQVAAELETRRAREQNLLQSRPSIADPAE